MEPTKEQLRAHFKALRASLGPEQRADIDARIADQVTALPAYASANLVLPYLAFGDEIETRGIIEAAWRDGKTVALPRCIPHSREMAWYVVTSFDGLVKSPFGVDEPAEDPANEIDVASREDALCLVPGLTFDGQGFRLGYGGGFYDTFLARFAGVSVGLCRSCQLVDDVPSRDAHDLPANFVVTETGVVHAG